MRQNTLPGAKAWLPFSQAPTSPRSTFRPSPAFCPLQQAPSFRVCPFPHIQAPSIGVWLELGTILCYVALVSPVKEPEQQPEERSPAAQGRAQD